MPTISLPTSAKQEEILQELSANTSKYFITNSNFYTGSSIGSSTPLNIIGKGRLYTAVFSPATNSETDISVEVILDGVTVINYLVSGSKENSFVGLVSNKTSYTNSDNLMPFYGLHVNIGNGAIKSSNKIISGGFGSSRFSVNGSDCLVSFIPEYISFNHSCKVNITHSDSVKFGIAHQLI